jgi:hypothetical protein
MRSDSRRALAGLSAEPAHLLVHQDEDVVALLLQQADVERPPARPAAREKDFPDFSNHGFHLLEGNRQPMRPEKGHNKSTKGN